jgi:hypothetical protein
MTIAQNIDKATFLDYIETNSDGSQTIKGILELRLSGERDTLCAYRIHVKSQIAIIADLPGSYPTIVNGIKVANLLINKYFQHYNLNPKSIIWVQQSEHYGIEDRTDLRRPFFMDRNYFSEFIMNWNGKSYQLPEGQDRLPRYKLHNVEKQFLESDVFGTVEDIANKLNWKRNINRIDIEYRIERVINSDLKIIKTIYFWEHPDYPAHCLVRILLHRQQAFVLITEIRSNIPPDRDNASSHTARKCMSIVINGIYEKFRQELAPYSLKDINWIYEYGFCSTFGERSGWAYSNYYSELYLLDPSWDNNDRSNPNFKLGKNPLDGDEITDPNYISLLRSEVFGEAEDSFNELGWRNC